MIYLIYLDQQWLTCETCDLECKRFTLKQIQK
jgi:hypothetical protein